ncbi:MAG: YccF domain-containing protein [Bacteroidaceae bacterium]|nr:YccF domain-containing protein [Bacteroidaceae bacterium]
MKVLGNIVWWLCGGLETAVEYFVASVALMITVVGIPFGLQTLKLGQLMLWPFGSRVVKKPTSGCLNMVMNVVWFFVGGIWIWLTHAFFGVLLYITIIGIPFGRQHFKLARIALTPFGREVFLNS